MMTTKHSSRRHVPVLIIGSGLAGCTAALTLADAGLEVLLLNTGDTLTNGNSEMAQGGIIYRAAQQDPANSAVDDAYNLAKDILVAGHYYNSRKAVRCLCRSGPKCVDEMLVKRAGVKFDRNADGSFNLTREGGHSAPRILHCADFTGRAIMDSLTARILEHPKITRLHKHAAIDLLTSHHHAKKSQYRYEVTNRCLGAYVLNEESGEPETILANWTVLATGGVGQVFLHSTNALGCVGAGVSMAYRAGVSLANLEFMQFHPTAFYDERGSRRPLITEALRGEGARLLDANGMPFMLRHDKRGDLAPRDIVALAMMEEMLHSGAPCLFLDASQVNHDLTTRFPTVFETCKKTGLDIRKDPIPVVPAAHYFCGGILADIHGRTSMRGLYAVGECACTGLHGANRLASSSLLEALVWGVACGQDIARKINTDAGLSKTLASAIPDWQHEGDDRRDDPALVAQDWASIRHTMWNYVGISRSKARLNRAFTDMRDLVRHIHDFYKHTRISRQLVDLFHGSQSAYVITQAAMRNPVSLGCHYRTD
ncbi:MAG: L-aspartate oxidase [Desulfovibrio sp.]|jgi:L-aspartate oxidase|nr:L-aspartate oxidase [Desulfovibrio sp.]